MGFGAGKRAMPVKILIDENDTIDAIISVPTATVEIVANVTRQGDTIKLDGVHVELLADGPLDRLNIGMLCTENRMVARSEEARSDQAYSRGGRHTTR
jgi:hypothetical protein